MICIVDNNKIDIKNLKFKELKTAIKNKYLSNNKEKVEYIYQSREYKILQWKIRPRIYLYIELDESAIEITCKKIDLNIPENISSSLKIYIKVIIRRFQKGIKIERILKICLANKESIKYMPKAIKEYLLKKATSLSSNRFDKRLIRKLEDLAERNSN
tara:strand:+ start:1384 stop:1857 length:474 start_codon:yes stop_codon:yes gene_type:complete